MVERGAMTTLKVCHHGNCFDGVTSAAIFTRFYRERVDPAAAVRYAAMTHGRGDPYGADHDAFFDGDVNAVLDFRYSPSPRLHWFCDHHQSAFLEPGHAAHLAADRSGRKRIDMQAPSCAGLLCSWLAAEHGFDAAPLADHVRWAELIDSARFIDARQAVELAEPALQLMALLESVPGDAMSETLITGLSRTSIAEVHAGPAVQAALGPVLEAHQRTIDVLRARLRVLSGVADFDLIDDGVAGFNKFIPYYLADGLAYTVGLTRSPARVKVSVGSNPWRRPEPLVNLAELCAAYGGGGHAVVAGIGFPPGEVAAARRAAAEIVARLRQGS
jgi:hypothetical protein